MRAKEPIIGLNAANHVFNTAACPAVSFGPAGAAG